MQLRNLVKIRSNIVADLLGRFLKGPSGGLLICFLLLIMVPAGVSQFLLSRGTRRIKVLVSQEYQREALVGGHLPDSFESARMPFLALGCKNDLVRCQSLRQAHTFQITSNSSLRVRFACR